MDTVNVRHDAPVEVTIYDGRRIVQRDTVEAYLVDAHLTVFSATHGGVSGYINWHDSNGQPIARPKVGMRLLDESYQLADGELCTCTVKCLPSNTPDLERAV